MPQRSARGKISKTPMPIDGVLDPNELTPNSQKAVEACPRSPRPPAGKIGPAKAMAASHANCYPNPRARMWAWSQCLYLSIYICIINLNNYYLKAGSQKNSYFDDADQVFRSFGLLQCHLWGLWCLMSIPRFPNQCKSSMFHWEYHWLIMVNDG